MYCPNCNTPRPNHLRFCCTCGTALIAPPQPKKGKLWPPIIFMAVMMLLGTLVFLIAPSPTPPATVFYQEDGQLVFQPDYYSGGPVVTVPESIDNQAVTKLSPNCFRDCDMISEVILPDTVQIIGQGAFADCDTLACIKLPEGLQTIEQSAFAGCDSLEAIYVPASVTSIAPEAFAACPKLHTIFYVGTDEAWNGLYPSQINENTKIYTVSGPDAQEYYSN